MPINSEQMRRAKNARDRIFYCDHKKAVMYHPPGIDPGKQGPGSTASQCGFKRCCNAVLTLGQ